MNWENLLKEVGNLLRFIQQVGEEGVEIHRSGKLGGLAPQGKSPAVYDLHLRLKSLDSSRQSSFKASTSAWVGEPEVDIFDESQWLVIVAQLPGILAQEEVHLEIQGQTLILRAGKGERKYLGRIPLPFPADLNQGQVSFNKGVLEVRLLKP